MRYKIPREKLKTSKNPFFLEAGLGDNFHFKGRNSVSHFEMEFTRGPSASFMGRSYVGDWDGLQEAANASFPGKADKLYRAHSQQSIVLLPFDLVSSQFKLANFDDVLVTSAKSFEYAIDKVDEAPIQTTTHRGGFPFCSSAEPGEVLGTIPGSLEIYCSYDVEVDQFQIEYILPSNRLLHAIVMGETGSLTLEDLSAPEIIEDELNFSFENSIIQEKRNLTGLVERIVPELGFQTTLKNGIEEYADLLKELNKSLYVKKAGSDSTDEAAMWQRLLNRKMDQILNDLNKSLQESPRAEISDKADDITKNEELISGLSRLKTKGAQIFINRAIVSVAEHGATISNNPDKKLACNQLVSDLKESSEKFYEAGDFSQESKQSFRAEFSRKIAEKREALSIPRGLLARVLQYVADAFRSLAKPKSDPAAQPPVAVKNSPHLFKTRSIKLTEEADQTAKTVLSF